LFSAFPFRNGPIAQMRRGGQLEQSCEAAVDTVFADAASFLPSNKLGA